MGLSFIVSGLLMFTFSTFSWFQYWSFKELKVFCARKFYCKLITGCVVEELQLTGVRNQQWWVDFWGHLLLFLPSRSNIYLIFWANRNLTIALGSSPGRGVAELLSSFLSSFWAQKISVIIQNMSPLHLNQLKVISLKFGLLWVCGSNVWQRHYFPFSWYIFYCYF